MATRRSTPVRRKHGSPDRIVRQQRRLQKRMERIDASRPSKDEKPAMQAGARHYPVPPLPRQHLRKPGLEAALQLQPMYEAPYYRGSDKLRNKVAIVTGGDSGIGRAVSV